MKKVSVIKIGLYFLLSASLIVYFVSKIEPTHGALTGLLLGFVFLSIVLFYVWIKIYNKNMTFMSLTPIFIIGYVNVFFLFSILRLINTDVLGIFERFLFYDITRIDTPLSLSTIGLISFLIGVTKVKRPAKQGLARKDFSKNYKSNKSTFFIVTIAYITFGAFLVSTPSYISGLYGNETSALSRYLFTFFNWFFYSAVILKIFSYSQVEMKNLNFFQYISSFGYLLLTLIIMYMLMSVYTGDRGPLISVTLVIVGFFYARKKNISLKTFLIIIILGAFVLTTIAESRTRTSGDGYIDRVSDATQQTDSTYFETPTFTDSFINLATSERSLNHVVLQVPEVYDYHYGVNQFQYLLSVIPGLSGLFFNVALDGDIKRQGSAMFTSYLIQVKFLGRNIDYGDGTTIISDLYLDFGWIGVILFMFAFGRLLSRYEGVLTGPTEIKILPFIFIILYFSQSLYLARSALLLEFGTVIMIYVIIQINHIFLFRETIK